MLTNISWIGKIFKAGNRKVSRGRRHSFSRIRKAWHKVELLEDGVVPTTYAWVPTAAGSYDWNNAANWTVVSGSGTTFPCTG